MDWKNFEKDRKSFGTVIWHYNMAEMWQKNTCGRATFLKT